MNYPGRQRANLEGFAIGEQPVKLRAIGGQVLDVEDALEGLLHGRHVLADRRGRSQSVFQERRRTEVVCVYMSFEYPLDVQLLFLYEPQHTHRRRCRGASGRRVEVQHRIDDGGFAGIRVGDNIRHGESGFVKKSIDVR